MRKLGRAAAPVPALAAAGVATGVLAIAFSTSPVVLNPSVPFALLALVLYTFARRITRLNRRYGSLLEVTGLGLSAIAAGVVFGLHT